VRQLLESETALFARVPKQLGNSHRNSRRAQFAFQQMVRDRPRIQPEGISPMAICRCEPDFLPR
jgi:hypothetical protein